MGYIDDHAQSMKVYDDNMVRFAKRVNFDIGCQMDFSNYPIDKQKCPVKLESFGYTAEVTISNIKKFRKCSDQRSLLL